MGWVVGLIAEPVGAQIFRQISDSRPNPPPNFRKLPLLPPMATSLTANLPLGIKINLRFGKIRRYSCCNHRGSRTAAGPEATGTDFGVDIKPMLPRGELGAAVCNHVKCGPVMRER
jgi:hypothetical protein